MAPFVVWKGVVAFTVGSAVGGVFLWGLWETVRRLPSARHPAWWALSSYVARLGGAALVLVWVARLGHWAYVALSLAGFILVRAVWMHRSSKRAADRTRTEEESTREHLA